MAHIPGLSVVVPSTPADAGGLLLAAIESEGPIVYLEHKLLADYWLDYVGGSTRETVEFDVPGDGARGPVPDEWNPISLGQAVLQRIGKDLTIVSIGVGVHRSIEAAIILEKQGISADIIDLRTVSPLDETFICGAVAKTGRMLVVDEDYQNFGLSGELAAIILKANLMAKLERVCTEKTIPYARHLEDQVLPNTSRIVSAALQLMQK